MDSSNNQIFYSVKPRIIAIAAGALLAFSAHATPLLNIDSSGLTAGDAIQLGRIGRDNFISDWSTPKAFPGVINPTTAYQFQAFGVNSGGGNFLQILVDSLSANTFASVYLGAYDPTNLALNYLGDAGNSGNFFGTDPRVFQVVVPLYTDLFVVVNETSGVGAGLLQPFKISVEGFVDTEFTDIPEPGSFGLAALGLLGIMAVRRRTTASCS